MARRDTDGQRIGLGIVIGDQQHGAAPRKNVSPATSTRPHTLTTGTQTAIATR